LARQIWMSAHAMSPLTDPDLGLHAGIFDWINNAAKNVGGWVSKHQSLLNPLVDAVSSVVPMGKTLKDIYQGVVKYGDRQQPRKVKAASFRLIRDNQGYSFPAVGASTGTILTVITLPRYLSEADGGAPGWVYSIQGSRVPYIGYRTDGWLVSGHSMYLAFLLMGLSNRGFPAAIGIYSADVDPSSIQVNPSGVTFTMLPITESRLKEYVVELSNLTHSFILSEDGVLPNDVDPMLHDPTPADFAFQADCTIVPGDNYPIAGGGEIPSWIVSLSF
jgi:hypothetical protein